MNINFPAYTASLFLLLYLMVTMKDKALLNLLLKNGWELTNVKGSQHRLRFLRIAKIYAYKAKETLCQPYGQQSVLLCRY